MCSRRCRGLVPHSTTSRLISQSSSLSVSQARSGQRPLARPSPSVCLTTGT
uniref:Uncharacterized protein n=1 Tax=Arundo donax TaxID=35708 RepID=A0A0A9FJT7_ARUDO